MVTCNICNLISKKFQTFTVPRQLKYRLFFERVAIRYELEIWLNNKYCIDFHACNLILRKFQTITVPRILKQISRKVWSHKILVGNVIKSQKIHWKPFKLLTVPR